MSILLIVGIVCFIVSQLKKDPSDDPLDMGVSLMDEDESKTSNTESE